MKTAQINLPHQLNHILYDFTYNDSWSITYNYKREKIEFEYENTLEYEFPVITYTNDISNCSSTSVALKPYSSAVSEGQNTKVYTSISQNLALNSLPLFFGKADLVKIPSKVKYAIKQIPAKTLKQVHEDKEVAYELCLMYLSQLTSTYFEVKSGANPSGWKSLHSQYLKELVGIDSTCYKRIRNVLEYKLENGAILECDYSYCSGRKNYNYRIGKYYMDKKVHAYKVTTEIAKKRLYNYYLEAYSRASENIICRNLFHLYYLLVLPTIEEIQQEANRLIRLGYKNKKGKTLARRNKHSNTYFSNYEQLTFVEDAIEIYNYLTNENGVIIPIVGGHASGGRIVDSFTLMPSWIRNMITIKGQRLQECDYQCLHPNIAMSIYGGNSQFITHKQLANHLKLDELIVKKEHLSFFNKPIIQMMHSPLWKYYMEKEPIMLENLVNDKLNNSIKETKDKHKITSQKLFSMEVSIMTRVIEQLNSQRIYVMYVYDALYCLPEQKFIVQEVMNTVILEENVFTSIKI